MFFRLYKLRCKDCSTCCELYPIDLNDKEYKILKNLKPDLKTDDFGVLHIIQPPCPFLIDHRCSIYEARPMACRLYPLAVKTYSYGYRIGAHGDCPEKLSLSQLLPIFELYTKYAGWLHRNPRLLQVGKKKRLHDNRMKETSKNAGMSYFYPEVFEIRKVTTKNG